MGEINLSEVEVKFISLEETKVIFSNLSCHFGPNGLISIIGESGSGKSTLLNLLAGYLSPNSGEVELSCRKDEIGVIFQNLYLIDHMNVMDNVILPLIILGHTKKESLAKGKEALLQVGLEGFEQRKIDELSGGQKARVGIARCLVTDSKIILADEPTGSLDTINSQIIMELLKKLSLERLVILVSHNEKQAEEYSSKVYLISDSRLKLIKDDKKAYFDNSVPSSQPKPIKLIENIRLAFSFLKKRMAKVMIGIFFVSICFGVILSLVTFEKKGTAEIASLGKDCLDYSLVTLSEKKTYSIPGQEMKLMKKVSLSSATKKQLRNQDDTLSFYPALDYFLPSFTQIQVEGEYLEDSFLLSPCFMEDYSKVEGRVSNSYSEVVVNSAFIKAAKGRLGINQAFSFKSDFVVPLQVEGEQTNDVINLEENLKIVGISKERDIVSRPTIYYSYFKMKDYLFSKNLSNASKMLDKEMTLNERMERYSSEDDSLTSFKTVCYVYDPLNFKKTIQTSFPLLTIVSLPLEIASSFKDILSSFSKIILLFMIMAVNCSMLLELVVIEDLLFEKREELAVYLSFHITKKDFFRIGRGQVWILGGLISLFSSLVNVILTKAINILLVNYGLNSFMEVELLSIYGIGLLLAGFICALITTDIPLRSIYSEDLIFNLKGE